MNNIITKFYSLNKSTYYSEISTRTSKIIPIDHHIGDRIDVGVGYQKYHTD